MKHHVLITGGSGFLGRHLARRLKNEGHEVVLGARNTEQLRLAALATGCNIIPLDVARRGSVQEAIRQVNPSLIVHAAATKYIDIAEKQPMDCIDVNVLGSQNVAAEAMACGVQYVIGISTDKATPPARNTYALSKALMERLFCSLSEAQSTFSSRPQTTFTCVRFGNIAWSTGSVLPLWQQMTLANGCVKTTAGPQVTRLMFTVDDAVDLVMTSLAHIDELHGKVLVREMKTFNVRELLKTWAVMKDCTWEQIEGRPGDRDDEHLVGDVELSYTQLVEWKEGTHFIVSLDKPQPSSLTVPLSSPVATKNDYVRIIQAEHADWD